MRNDNAVYEFNFDKVYGLKSYDLEEELNLPENIKRTRCNKVHIIKRIDLIKRTLDSISFTAKRCPELDNKKHADLVDELSKMIDEIDELVDKALRLGYN